MWIPFISAKALVVITEVGKWLCLLCNFVSEFAKPPRRFQLPTDLLREVVSVDQAPKFGFREAL